MSCEALLKAHSAVVEQEEKYLERIEKLWSKFEKDNFEKAEGILQDAKIVKNRLKIEDSDLAERVFGD